MLIRIPSSPDGQRGAGSAPHRQTNAAFGRHPAGRLRLPLPTPPTHVFLEDSINNVQAQRPGSHMSVPGGETKAREWIGHSAWPQTPAQLLTTLGGLPEAQGSLGPGKAPAPQRPALGWGTAGEKEAALSAWESLGHIEAAFPLPGEAAGLGGLRDLRSRSHAPGPCRAVQGGLGAGTEVWGWASPTRSRGRVGEGGDWRNSHAHLVPEGV